MSFPPYPYPYPPGAPGARRRSHPFRAPLIALAVIVALGVGIAAALAVTNHGLVNDADDVSAGDCVRVTSSGEGTVESREADCGDADFTFYVASRSTRSGARCATSDYSQIAFRDGGYMCLAPNWRAGRCYEVPRSSSPSSTYRERGCATPPTDSAHPIVEITARRDGTTDPDCAESDSSVSFALPEPVGYCYALASDVPA